jgi:hypothetical protein
VNTHNADPDSSQPASARRASNRTPGAQQTPAQRQHMQGLGHDAPAPADESDKAEVARLQASFPQFRIWRESTYRGPRYIACSRQLGTRPHTLITSDLGELRAELGTGGPA